jgi:hypothetical protein
MRTTVVIAIYYLSVDSGTNILQRGEFKLRGKKPEEVALGFWRQIQREMPVEVVLVKATCDGDEITDLVKELEKK